MKTREELYELVWSKPMTKVAEELQVSGSYMARVCTVLNVPRPDRGYWAKLEVGKASPKPPLPEAREGDAKVWSKDTALGSRPSKPEHNSTPPSSERKSKVIKTHPLIGGARAHFEHTRNIKEGSYLRPYKKSLVDITTSKACLERSLAFANTLFLALERAGHRVTLPHSSARLSRKSVDEREVPKGEYREDWDNKKSSPNEPTVVYVNSVPIGLSIIETTEEVLLRYVNGSYARDSEYKPPKLRRYEVDHSWTTTRNIPSGRLRLIAYAPYYSGKWSKTWDDVDGSSLNKEIETILRTLEKAAPTIAADEVEAQKQRDIESAKRRAEFERWERQDDQRKIAESKKESKEHLSRVIEQWAQAVAVQNFLASVEERINRLPEEERSKAAERLQLAKEFIGKNDPLEQLLAWRTPQERYKPIF